MDAAAAKQTKLSPSSPKKEFFESSDKTSSTTGSSATMFLVDMYPDPGPLVSVSSVQIIRFNLFRFLGGKGCSSVCPEKITENSIQMVSAPCLCPKERIKPVRSFISGYLTIIP